MWVLFIDAGGPQRFARAGTENQDDESDELSFLTRSTRPDSLGRIGHYEVLQVLGKRILREARSSAQVRHENVVQVYGVEEQDETEETEETPCRDLRRNGSQSSFA